MTLPLALWSLQQTGMVALLVLGFGFVIFWHELGHFLAAKWVGIKVEQFAVGFGQALFAWRKGVGFRLGNTQKDYRERVEQHLIDKQRQQRSGSIEKPEFSEAEQSAAADELGLGETEYRLNWIPLGGYVKMLGQDDLKPDALADDPRAFNRKSVGARMLVISAGVIMNVILAGIMFMILFRWGFNVAPAWIGNVIPNSPAQRAGLQPGDRIISFDGKSQDDFTKIMLNTALVKEGEPVQVLVDRPTTPEAKEFKRLEMTITAARQGGGGKGFLAIGFEPPRELKAVPPDKSDTESLEKLKKDYPSDAYAVQPGETITAVNGQPVGPLIENNEQFILFDRALQASKGAPVDLMVRGVDGKERHEQVHPHFMEPFDGPFNIAGIVPRTQVSGFAEDSSVHGDGQLQFGDVIASINDGRDPLPNPTREQLMERLNTLGRAGKPFDALVLRDGKEVLIKGLKAGINLERPTFVARMLGSHEGRFGMGVVLIHDEQQAVVGDVQANSPAAKANLKNGDQLLTVAGNEVKNWSDVRRTLVDNAKAGEGVKITYHREHVEQPQEAMLPMDADALASVRDARYFTEIQQTVLAEYTIDRRTDSLAIAAKWGASETRDFILQFYLTLRRMVGGSVSPANMMGPVGIFIGGARFAQKGGDWLLWFLAMISANLAVVNFLPIPVVDGGQFVFLILEKIKGKPLSPKTMAIAQYVGLAFLAGVVLFVTFNDVMRHY